MNAIETRTEYPDAGDYVTVVRWRDRPDRSYVGDVLRVVTVDAPFVLVERLWASYGWTERKRPRVSLSAADVVLQRLSPDYVRAAVHPEQDNAFAGLPERRSED